MRSLKTDFLRHSVDYLQLLGLKAHKAKNNKTFEEEFAVMEFYHDGIEAIINEYDKQIHLLTLEKVNSEVKTKLIQGELEAAMRDLFNVSLNRDEPKKRPTESELKRIEKRHKDGVSIMTIMEHFNLSDNQIKTILDNG